MSWLKNYLKFIATQRYYENFFTGVFGGLALAITMEAKGLQLFTLPGFFGWLVFLAGFIIVFLLGGLVIYNFTKLKGAKIKK